MNLPRKSLKDAQEQLKRSLRELVNREHRASKSYPIGGERTRRLVQPIDDH